MTPPDAIELRSGSSPWMRICHHGVSLLGLLAILTSGAQPGWLAAAVTGLCLVHAGTARRMRKSATSGRLLLHRDGSANLVTASGHTLAWHGGAGWATRWCCVLPLQRVDGGNRIQCIVCRSLNSADSYRHLLVRLRMGGADGRDRWLGWS